MSNVIPINRGRKTTTRKQTPPAHQYGGPPHTASIGSAIRIAFAMAYELTGCYSAEEVERWRSWLTEAQSAILKTIPPGVRNAKLERKPR